MAKIWKKRIEARTQSFDDCPDKYRVTVLELLREDVKEGNKTPNGEVMTPELFEELTGIKY